MPIKKKPAAKKPAVKKVVAKKPAAKPAVKNKPAAKKPAAKKPVAKKVAAKKPAPKPVAKKPIVKKPAPKPAPKKVSQPIIVKKPEVKEVKKPVPPVVQAPVAKPPVKTAVSSKPVFKPVTNVPPPKPKKQPEVKTGKLVIPKTTTSKSVRYEPEFTKSVLDSKAQEYSGPTMRYSDSDLNEFRDIIGKKIEAAKKELNYLQGLITRKDESGDMEDARYMTMEDGGISMEREQLSQMASRQITFIDHLEKAMMRIENKTYGVCRVTGKLIDKARLRAVPHATLSIEAKQMMK
jgi:RNA polymerase-binding transcription factor DksA